MTINLNIETLILVAVWKQPFIFQGCFKITELNNNEKVLFFFRGQSSHATQNAIIQNEFSPYDYELTHLYNNLGLVQINMLNQTQEDALYLLKYALHTTLCMMLTRRNQYPNAIDDVAMQMMIDKITPIINKESPLPEGEDHIGFAVAMDFCPKEEMGLQAATTLLSKFKNQVDTSFH
jgi:hypothetical protein